MYRQVEIEVDMSGSDSVERAILYKDNLFECLSRYFYPHWVVVKINSFVEYNNFIKTIVNCISNSPESLKSDVFIDLYQRNRIIAFTSDIVSAPDYPLYIGKVNLDIPPVNYGCASSINPTLNKNSLVKKVLKRSIEI